MGEKRNKLIEMLDEYIQALKNGLNRDCDPDHIRIYRNRLSEANRMRSTLSHDKDWPEYVDVARNEQRDLSRVRIPGTPAGKQVTEAWEKFYDATGLQS